MPYFLMRHSRVIRRVCPHYPPNEPNYDQLAAIHVLVSYKHRGKHDTARAEQSVEGCSSSNHTFLLEQLLTVWWLKGL